MKNEIHVSDGQSHGVKRKNESVETESFGDCKSGAGYPPEHYLFVDRDGYKKVAYMSAGDGTTIPADIGDTPLLEEQQFPDADGDLTMSWGVIGPSPDAIFQSGSFKGMRWYDVLTRHTKETLAMVRTKKTTKEIQEFSSWVTQNFTINKKTHQVEYKMPNTFDWESGEYELRQGPKSGCRRCDPCTNMTTLGSSAKWCQWRCLDCGVVYRKLRKKPTENPETCRHLDTDSRGSNVEVHRTFCKDCGTYIDCVSQESYRATRKSAIGLTKDYLLSGDILGRKAAETPIPTEDAVSAAKMFLQITSSADQENVALPAESKLTYTYQQLISTLCDSIDTAVTSSAQATQPGASASSRTPPPPRRTAFMLGNTFEDEDGYSTQWHVDVQPTHLRVVDPLLDDGVWAIIDEGLSLIHI